MDLKDEHDITRKKLLFRARRRGFREVDLLFGAFAEAHLGGLNAEQLERFEALLQVPDWQVYAWCVGNEKVPAEFDTDVFSLLRAYTPKV